MELWARPTCSCCHVNFASLMDSWHCTENHPWQAGKGCVPQPVCLYLPGYLFLNGERFLACRRISAEGLVWGFGFLNPPEEPGQQE